MSKRLIAPFLFGLIGAAILLALGVWQLERLNWKNHIIAEIGARIDQPPVALPEHPVERRDEYLAVRATGRFDGGEIHVLTSRAELGPGYRLIAAFESGNRRVLVDRGFILQDRKDDARAPINAELWGNLLWPDEVDPTFTPPPDIEKNIWFARDVPAMAKHLGTEPVLIVLNKIEPDDHTALLWPVTVAGIRNAHLNYAITWFLLAVSWLGMTGYWLWRISRRLD
ncbi:MAG: SURF1 family protein [Rhodobacteraceae bacterium]|nr:SURF1 family protein [Paracoccaceae bacterium]